jgi:hypothetical protein
MASRLQRYGGRISDRFIVIDDKNMHGITMA